MKTDRNVCLNRVSWAVFELCGILQKAVKKRTWPHVVAVVDQPELEQFPKGGVPSGSLKAVSGCLSLPPCSIPLPPRVLGAGRGGRRAAYRLHGVVHRQEGLQALPLQHVGELHVDGFHGPRVTHDPVLVGVGRVVVTWGAGGKTPIEVRPGRGLGCWALPPPPPAPICLGKQPLCARAAAQAETPPLWTPACRGLCPQVRSASLCVWGMPVGRLGGTQRQGTWRPPGGLSLPSQPCQHAQRIKAEVSACAGLSPPSDLPTSLCAAGEKFKLRTTHRHSTAFIIQLHWGDGGHQLPWLIKVCNTEFPFAIDFFCFVLFLKRKLVKRFS